MRFDYGEGAGIAVPAGLRSKAALMAAWGKVLPDWFGRNWDALEECLGDLTQPIRHEDLPLDGEAECQVYLEILQGLAVRVSFPAHLQGRIEAVMRGDAA